MALFAADGRSRLRPCGTGATRDVAQAKLTLIELLLRVHANSGSGSTKADLAGFIHQFLSFTISENAVSGAIFRMSRHVFLLKINQFKKLNLRIMLMNQYYKIIFALFTFY